MPYIITTTYDRPSHPGWPGEQTRRAVATLDEAREQTYWLAHEADRGGSGDADAAYTVPEAGGTIGPLADGTVIEVRHVDWIAMRKLAGSLPVRTHDKPTVLATFNAEAGR